MGKQINKTDVYQMVTDRIMAELEKGIIPWQMPWSGTGACVSYESGKSYSPLNCFLLGEPGEYITCNQCNKLGGTVKKGVKGKMVVFHKVTQWEEEIKNEEGEVTETKTHTKFTLKYYNVFNIKDCEGIEPKWNVDERVNSTATDEQAESVVTSYEAKESHLKINRNEASSEAYFSPSRDCIVVPMISQYEDVAEYYSTLYHEMVHSTGIESRCNRDLGTLAAHGKEEYSQEELVAEMGAAMLVNHVGLDASKAFKNSVAYIQSWLKVLKNDKKLLVIAAARAEKAVRYILG